MRGGEKEAGPCREETEVGTRERKTLGGRSGGSEPANWGKREKLSQGGQRRQTPTQWGRRNLYKKVTQMVKNPGAK